MEKLNKNLSVILFYHIMFLICTCVPTETVRIRFNVTNIHVFSRIYDNFYVRSFETKCCLKLNKIFRLFLRKASEIAIITWISASVLCIRSEGWLIIMLPPAARPSRIVRSLSPGQAARTEMRAGGGEREHFRILTNILYHSYKIFSCLHSKYFLSLIIHKNIFSQSYKNILSFSLMNELQFCLLV